jgi:hypothetical protein
MAGRCASFAVELPAGPAALFFGTEQELKMSAAADVATIRGNLIA